MCFKSIFNTDIIAIYIYVYVYHNELTALHKTTSNLYLDAISSCVNVFLDSLTEIAPSKQIHA